MFSISSKDIGLCSCAVGNRRDQEGWWMLLSEKNLWKEARREEKNKKLCEDLLWEFTEPAFELVVSWFVRVEAEQIPEQS